MLLPPCGSAITSGFSVLSWILYMYPADEESVEGYVVGLAGPGSRVHHFYHPALARFRILATKEAGKCSLVLCPGGKEK